MESALGIDDANDGSIRSQASVTVAHHSVPSSIRSPYVEYKASMPRRVSQDAGMANTTSEYSAQVDESMEAEEYVESPEEQRPMQPLAGELHYTLCPFHTRSSVGWYTRFPVAEQQVSSHADPQRQGRDTYTRGSFVQPLACRAGPNGYEGLNYDQIYNDNYLKKKVSSDRAT